MEIDELRSLCRKHIESLEYWAKRLIDEKLSSKYGNNFYNHINENGEPIIKKSIKEKAERLKRDNPQRFNRFVDSLFFEDIIHILCNPKFYNDLFKEALSYSYPQGKEMVREYLNRILPVRNSLSHSNPISVRQAEQVICYSNDFIDSLKEYYKIKGLENMFNVPTIIKATDSLGNEFYPSDYRVLNIISVRDKNGIFRIGDTYNITIEVDPSFEQSSYTIHWIEKNTYLREDLINSFMYHKTFETKDVGYQFNIGIEIITNNDWHKHIHRDDYVNFIVTVLPPGS